MALLNHKEMQIQQKLHFVLVPLMAPGHFIPILDMAILLARRGHIATIITTPLIASRYNPVVDRAVLSGLQIQLLQVKFPTAEVGLREGCESMEHKDSVDSLFKFLNAIQKLQQPFEEVFRKINPFPSCKVADKHIIWLADIASKFSIPRIAFDGMSCFTLVMNHNMKISKLYEIMDGEEPFVVPGLPHRVELTKAQLPPWFSANSQDYKDFWEKIEESESQAYGMVINSFEELEPNYIELLKKVKGERIWTIGPLSMSNKSDLDKSQRGNKPSLDEETFLNWLDTHDIGTVVYACLGSLPCLTLPQLRELGLGLEASNRPFIWVIRKRGELDKEINKWIKEDGFEERTRGRGLIIWGWAPQVLILSHRSVGAFLTHCGWNSTLEGISAGLPMITWPMFAEQFYNEKFLVNVLEIGVSVGAKFIVPFCGEDNYGVVVKRDMVTEAVRKAMDEGQEGRERRSRAKILQEKAEKAMEEEGSSYLNMTLLIEDIMNLEGSRYHLKKIFYWISSLQDFLLLDIGFLHYI